MEEKEELPEPWILFTDGSSCTDGSGAGLILTNPEGIEFTYALRFRFDATNNEAEYEALIAGLRIAEQMGVKNLQANVDSRLVANQVNGTYVAKEADMIRYLEKVKALTGGFKAFTIKQIPRSENKKADALSKIASTSFAHLSKQVLVEELKEKSISEVEILTVVEEEGDTWMTPIYKYLAEETLPADMKKARAIRRKSWRFAVINGILYKKSFLGPWLRGAFENRSQLMNFVSKFLGTVRFRNDQIARIMGYDNYQLGNVIISRVYYIKGLGHNLFSVVQFSDADLEVAFRKNTCFIQNLEGVDLLSGSRDINLYTVFLDDMLKSSPICLLSKASKTKS
ncbi:reverse transcriptase domain-containing protein [Tanacetum coccineum]